jgi:ABC-2 type transport system ATP-binding protein
VTRAATSAGVQTDGTTMVGMEVRGLGQRYGGDVWALQDLDLRLTTGVTALVGVNGAGKSTLLTALSGARQPTVGTVLMGGADLYGKGRRRILPRIALMPQQLDLPQALTAFETVSLIGWMRGLNGRATRRAADAALHAVDLQERRNSRIKDLSGGMKRRIALAQALVGKPDVLLLDEPSTGLDPQQRRRMVEIVKTLPGSVLFSSHVMEDVVDTADRVIILHEGRMLFDGTMDLLSSLAPSGSDATRRAESALLHLIATRDGRRR